MENIKSYEEFISEGSTRTPNKYTGQKVKWTEIKPGDYIADGPNIGEVSVVLKTSQKGLVLKRVWNNVSKKNGEEFTVDWDHSAMKAENDYDVYKVIDFVAESVTNEAAEQDYLVTFYVIDKRGDDIDHDWDVKASSPSDAIDKVKGGKVKGPYDENLPRNARAFSAQLKKK